MSSIPYKTILALYKNNHSYRKTAKAINKSHEYVRYSLKNGISTSKKPKTGRPSLINKRTSRHILRYIKKYPNFKPKTLLNDLKLPFSYHTLLRFIKKAGFSNKKVIKKPFITSKTKQKRSVFAHHHIHMPKMLDMMIFTDEKRFCLDGVFSGESKWVDPTDQTPKNFKRVNKGYEKQSLMVWGAISSLGCIHLQLINGTMNSDSYISLLKGKFKKKVLKMFGEDGFILCQDNAPCHVSNKLLDFFSESHYDVMNLPPSSPDLNPIENAWAELSRRVYNEGRVFTSKKKLWEVVLKEWEGLEVEYVKKLVYSWNDRLGDVLENIGELTKY